MGARHHRRIVVKVGTNVLTTTEGLPDIPVITSLVAQIASIKRQGTEVILVSSGAMAAGRAVLKAKRGNEDVGEKQVLAAVGQVRLMSRYADLFERHGIVCAQVLATKEDFRDRRHYLNMRGCFEELLTENIIPIVNENDVVTVDELMFTDNDELAGLIASMVGADTLMILSSVAGILTGAPDDPATTVIHEVRSDADWKKHLRPGTSSFGRGGMHTKCESARKLSSLGITTHIALGREPDVLRRILDGEKIGTVFLPEKTQSTIKRWVAESRGQEKGVVTINRRAVDAITAAGKARSLLPVGIVKIEGEFSKGDLLRITSDDGREIGIGRAQYASGPAREAMGKQGQRALVHYDYLYLK